MLNQITHYDFEKNKHDHLTKVVGKSYDLYSTNFTPESGNRSQWSHTFSNNSSYPWYKSGDIFSELTIQSNGAGGTSTCLSDHKKVIFLIGGGTSNYLSSEITGLQFSYRAGSWGKNRIYPLYWGYWLAKPGTSNKYRWSSNAIDTGVTEYRSISHNFPNDVLNKLNDGYVFRYFMWNIDNHRLGSKAICETSYMYVKDFKFKYKYYASNQKYRKLMIPKARSWSNAGKRYY